MAKNKLVSPVVKWVGGKRQLLDAIKQYIPHDISTYYEPFFGGGAVLFEMQPRRAVINDINEELINLYRIIQSDVDSLIEELKTHKNEAEYFYRIRAQDRDEAEYGRLTSVQRAARIVYLNKTCYNGLFRVNRQGQFNTPFGYYSNPNIVNEITLRAVSEYFRSANIRITCQDFEDAVKGARSKAFVYFDPPYDPISNTSSFTGYDKGGFDRDEQIRLKNLCDRLNERGVRFLLSNSHTQFIWNLYEGYERKIVKAKRAINSRADKRGEIDELLVMNYGSQE